MTPREFIERYPGVGLADLVLIGNNPPGKITELPDYELQLMVRRSGLEPPEANYWLQLTCAYLVEIEWHHADAIRVARLRGQLQKMLERAADAPVKTTTDAEGNAVPVPPRAGGAKGRFTLPAKIGKDHPQHAKAATVKGQQGLIQIWFRAHPEGGTAEQIALDLVACGFKPNQSPVRAVYYHLNEWKKKGWLLDA
jgi:hypothetical protein